MHLLDTDTLSHLHKGNRHVAEKIGELADPELATTIVTKAEILRGRIDQLLKADNADLRRAKISSRAAKSYLDS